MSILFIRGETRLGAVMTDDEISWLKQNCSNVHYAQINSVGHLLHLEDQGQTPVLTEMTTFLERIPKIGGAMGMQGKKLSIAINFV